MRPFLEGGVGNPAALHSLGLEARASLDGARAKVARLVGGAAAGRHLHGQRHRGQQPGDQGRDAACAAAATSSPPRSSTSRSVNSVPRPREAGLERDLVAGRRRGARRSRGRRRGPCAPTRRSSRSWPPTARSAPCSPCARSAGWPGVGACPSTSTASARSGRLPLAVDECRDRSADALVQRPLRAAGRRGALGAARDVALAPIVLGGGQEGGYRSGTENLPAIVGMGVAADLARNERAGGGHAPVAAARPAAGRPARAGRAARGSPGARGARRLPHHASVVVPGVKADAVLLGARPPWRRRLLGLGLQPHHRRALARAARDRLRRARRPRARSASRSAAGRPPAEIDAVLDVAARRRRLACAGSRRGERGPASALPVRHRRHAGDRARRRPVRALGRALLATYGITGPIEAYDFRGKTDPRIVSDLMRGAGLDDARIAAGAGRLLRGLRGRAGGGHRRRRARARSCPASPSVVRALAARDDAVRRAAHRQHRDGRAREAAPRPVCGRSSGVGAFGSDDIDRRRLPAIACERAPALIGRALRVRAR